MERERPTQGRRVASAVVKIPAATHNITAHDNRNAGARPLTVNAVNQCSAKWDQILSEVAFLNTVSFHNTLAITPKLTIWGPSHEDWHGGAALQVKLRVNGADRTLEVDPRTTLLDALRENLKLTGTKKGCDQGQCGVCTVLVDGVRINACLSLAVMHDGQHITTIEGLAPGPDELHPLQAAFLDRDAFQCGYCTPGQICSAYAMIEEAKAGQASHVTADLSAPVTLTDAEIRERMSGNLCRCSAYPNILAAIRDVVDA